MSCAGLWDGRWSGGIKIGDDFLRHHLGEVGFDLSGDVRERFEGDGVSGSVDRECEACGGVDYDGDFCVTFVVEDRVVHDEHGAAPVARGRIFKRHGVDEIDVAQRGDHDSVLGTLQPAACLMKERLAITRVDAVGAAFRGADLGKCPHRAEEFSGVKSSRKLTTILFIIFALGNFENASG